MKLQFPFDTQPRVRYRTNPLVEVICQFQFPKLLRVEAELPADFQDNIKFDFPILKENSGYEIAMEIGEEEIGSPIAKKTPVNSYDFLSDDRIWKVGLSGSSISLSCTKYKRWEDFKKHLQSVYNVFVEIYQPAYISRCGLRYINVIDPLLLDLNESDFSKLISANLVGEQYKSFLGNENTREFSGTYSVALSDAGHSMRVNYGLVKHPKDNRLGFKIDADFWVAGKLEANSNDITQSLAQFNRGAGSLFRHSIEDQLHQSLGPEDIS